MQRNPGFLLIFLKFILIESSVARDHMSVHGCTALHRFQHARLRATAESRRKRFVFKFDNYVSRVLYGLHLRVTNIVFLPVCREKLCFWLHVPFETISYGNENIHCSYRIQRVFILNCSLDLRCSAKHFYAWLFNIYLTFRLLIDCSNGIKWQSTFFKYQQYTRWVSF